MSTLAIPRAIALAIHAEVGHHGTHDVETARSRLASWRASQRPKKAPGGSARAASASRRKR